MTNDAATVDSLNSSKANSKRECRRAEIGIVISDARQKTITVEARRLIKHARYGKYLFRSTHLHAHDEKNEAKKGDRVEVIACRPLSKQKRWRLSRIVTHAAELGSLDIKEVEIASSKSESSSVTTESVEEEKGVKL